MKNDDILYALTDIREDFLEEAVPVRCRPLSRWLTAALNRFLAGLPPKKRELFLRRYWYFSTLEELGRDFGMSESNVKMTLLRLRQALKAQLKQEGIEP